MKFCILVLLFIGAAAQAGILDILTDDDSTDDTVSDVLVLLTQPTTLVPKLSKFQVDLCIVRTKKTAINPKHFVIIIKVKNRGLRVVKKFSIIISLVPSNQTNVPLLSSSSSFQFTSCDTCGRTLQGYSKETKKLCNCQCCSKRDS